jgi:predicted O-linked N-acetylglucosamine transferase (SPINDLY family)
MKFRDLLLTRFSKSSGEPQSPTQVRQSEDSESSPLARNSNDWEAVNALALTALQSGELQKAIELYSTLLEHRPDFAEGYYKRGNAYNRAGNWSVALSDYDQAIALDPRFANAFCNRGTVLERLSRWNEALESYNRALELNPGDAFAHYNRAGVLRELHRFEEAIASYDRAISLNPGYVEAYVNRGHMLQKLSRYEQAAASYGKAFELRPIRTQAGQPAALAPEQKYVLGLKRQSQMQICDWQGFDDDLELIAEGLRAKLPVILPFAWLAMLDDPALQRAAAETWVREEAPPAATLGAITRRTPGRKIHIGYFSADFRIHPVSYLTAGLFESHDRSRFDVTAFAFGPPTNDPMRARLTRAFDRFIDVRERTDAEVASLARNIGIDIAVNLNGITEFSRSPIFALRAAPIQVNYLGYPGTMGAEYMDYLIADGAVIPRARQGDYSEKIIYLPDSFMPFDASYSVADRTFTREELGLPPDGFVYCCFNGSHKITPMIFVSWMRLLQRNESCVLWLSATNPTAAANLRKAARQHGVDDRRLIFAKQMQLLPEHVARLRAADLFLDTFPYNAHSTAVDALFAGLPVLTYAGTSFASRVANSLLRAVGVHETIAGSLSEYEAMATDLALDASRLGRIRRLLAGNHASMPLFDTARYTRNLERAYEVIHDRHHSGASPEHVNDHLAQ